MLQNKNEEFIKENLGLVHSCCHRFAGRSIEYDDLFQAGCVGLVKAAKGFDQSRGLMFSTYAVPVILGEIKRLFRDGGSVKISRSIKELYLKIGYLSEKIEKSTGKSPTISQLADKLGVTEQDITESICACQPTMSLTYEDDEGEKTLPLPSNDCTENITDKIFILESLKKLSNDEQKIIVMRYFEEKTQTEVADILGITQVQVSRKEKKLLQKLRSDMYN